MNVDVNSIVVWADEWGTAFNLVLFLILFFLTRKIVIKQGDINGVVYFFCIAIILIFYEFPFWGDDWLHYYEYMSIDNDLMESIYYDIADFLGGDYLIWRLFVWGSSLILNVFTAKRLGIRRDVFIAFYVCVCVLLLSYSRASLAMSLSILGYSYFIKPLRSKIISYSLGIAVICFSLSFHRSAVILVAAYLLSLAPLNKTLLKYLILGLPIVFVFISVFGVSNIVDGILMRSDLTESAEKFKDYSNAEDIVAGPVDILVNFFQFGAFYLGVWFVIRCVKNGFYDACGKEFQQMAKCVVWIVMMASVFVVSPDISGIVLFYRTIYYAVVPISLLLALYCSEADVVQNDSTMRWSLSRYVSWNYYFFAIFSFLSLTKWFVVPFLSDLYHSL